MTLQLLITGGASGWAQWNGRDDSATTPGGDRKGTTGW